MLIPLSVVILITPLLYIFRDTLYRLFEYQPEFLWMIPSFLVFNYCYEALFVLLIIEKKTKQMALMTVIRTGVEIIFSFLLIYTLFPTWYGRALGYGIGMFVMTNIFIRYVIKNKFLTRNINTRLLRRELTFGVAGFSLQMAIFFLISSDKFFVMVNYGKTMAGFYSVAATFATIQYIFSSSLLQYLQPIIYKSFSEGKYWSKVKPLFMKYVLIMASVLFLLILITTFIYHYIIKESYKEHIYVFYILATSTFIWSISNLFLQTIIYHKNKRIISTLSAIIIILAFSINYFTSKHLNIFWLGIGQIFSNSIMLLLVLYFSQKSGFFHKKVLQ